MRLGDDPALRQYHVVFTCSTFASSEEEAISIAKDQVSMDHAAHTEVEEDESDGDAGHYGA